MKISDIFQYIFDDRAVITSNHRVVLSNKQQLIENKRKAIKKDFEGILNNPAIKQHFKNMLLDLNRKENKTSFTSLYNIIADDGEELILDSTNYLFPNDTTIIEQFQLLNERYKFLTDEALPDFQTLFKACKLTADYIEKNNNEKNELAFLHAYKLMVLFDRNKGTSKGKRGDIFKYINAYSRQHVNTTHPVHDALINELPVNDPPLKYLPEWHKFIQKYGPKAMRFFALAPKIEAKLGRAPQTFHEAEGIVSQLRYARAEEDSVMARLFVNYHLPEKVFNRCLELKKQRKTTDKLPSVSVNGQSIGHNGYHLVKLPINDPRAFILGHITNCCQSINGHAKQCVIDGVTLQHNGFYVLLKQTGKTAVSPVQNNEIDYENFKIVGQGYAWLSKNGNLTFDSWENLRTQDDPIISSMLVNFAQQVTAKDPGVLQVTIGMGGKTPDEWYRKGIDRPEIMVEGYQYSDSKKQALIFLNEDNLKRMQNDLEKLIDNQFMSAFADEAEFKVFKDFIEFKSIRGQKDLSIVCSFLQTYNSTWVNYLNENQYNLKFYSPMSKFYFFEMAILLIKNNLHNKERLQKLYAIYNDIVGKTSFYNILHCLQTHKILLDENIDNVLNLSGREARDLKHILNYLVTTELFTNDNVALLLATDNFSRFGSIREILKCISGSPNKLTNSWLRRIISLPDENLLKLEKNSNLLSDNSSLDERMFSFIVDNSVKDYPFLLKAMSELLENKIFSEELLHFVKSCINKRNKNYHYPCDLVQIIKYTLNNGLFNDENRSLLLRWTQSHANDASRLQSHLGFLEKEACLDNQMFQLLLSIPRLSNNGDCHLNLLDLKKLGILDNHLIDFINNYSTINPTKVDQVLLALKILYECSLFNQKNCLIDYTHNPSAVAFIFATIKDNGFWNERYKDRILKVEHPNELKKIIFTLKQYNIPMDEALFESILTSTIYLLHLNLDLFLSKAPSLLCQDLITILVEKKYNEDRSEWCHSCSHSTCARLILLHEKKILTPENFAFLVNHRHEEDDAIDVLNTLHRTNLLTPENVKIFDRTNTKETLLLMRDFIISLHNCLKIYFQPTRNSPNSEADQPSSLFFQGKFFDSSAEVKVRAVKKLCKLLAGEEVQLKHLELEALQDKPVGKVIQHYYSLLPSSLTSSIPYNENINRKYRRVWY